MVVCKFGWVAGNFFEMRAAFVKDYLSCCEKKENKMAVCEFFTDDPESLPAQLVDLCCIGWRYFCRAGRDIER